MELGATAALTARLTLAAAFGYSAATKLRDRKGFARALADFGVPAGEPVAAALPVVEAALAVLLVAVPGAAWPAFAAGGVLLLFTAAVIASLQSGSPKPCPCFGPPDESARPVSAATVARNGYLVALAVLGTGSTAGASVAAALAASVVTAAATLVALRRWG